MYKIQILNNIAQCGLALFDNARYQVAAEVHEADAILLRSANICDTPLPETLRVVGRAGVGVNNIPVAKLTEQGIPVVNTPGANANAVKELVVAGLLLASRHICHAWDYARQLTGQDDEINQQAEKNKKKFAGSELPGKTLGVIGLGHIGVKVANVAVSLGMRVVGFDPNITIENAWQLSALVNKAQSITEVYQQADFISLHVPLLEKTRHLITTHSIALMKKGAVLLNFARAPIVDEHALLKALDSQQIAYYVTDFPSQLLQRHAQVISLPHLGASTHEAEENCAVMAVEQIKDYLESGSIKNSVNFPRVSLPDNKGAHRLAVVNYNIPNMVAQISSVLSKAGLNILEMVNKSRDDIAYSLFDLSEPIETTTLQALAAIEGVVRVRVIF